MNYCVLIMYNSVLMGAILIMRSSTTERSSALKRKSLLRCLMDGNGQGFQQYSS